MGYVLAVPDSPAVRLLDHRRVVEAPRLLNVRRLQVLSHNHILLSSPKKQTADDSLQACRSGQAYSDRPFIPLEDQSRRHPARAA